MSIIRYVFYERRFYRSSTQANRAIKITKVKGYLYFIKVNIDKIEIVSFIKNNISKFQADKQLIDFYKFLNLNNNITDLKTKLEHLFLNYDVYSIDIEKLQSMLDSFSEELNDLKKNSRKVK